MSLTSGLSLLVRLGGFALRRTPTTAGLRRSLVSLRRELDFAERHRRSAATIRALGRSDLGYKLNLGCGPKVKPGWLNIDAHPAADFALDLREPLPFPDESCEMIYSEHFMEHVEYPTTLEQLLRECHRVLQPGGVFSVGVPDAEVALHAYSGNDEIDFFRTSKARWHPDWAETRMEHINCLFRNNGDHEFAYDAETLTKVLGEAGFSEIRPRGFDPELDCEDRRWGTLYMEARRP
jgi:predicted SAM-dependent methyltransferase